MPRPRPPKSKQQHAPGEGADKATRQGRVLDPHDAATDTDAPTRVMRQGGEEIGPRPGRPASATDEPSVAPQVSESDTTAQPRRSGGARISGLGSGLLARQPSPSPGEGVTVRRVCPHCGTEYETDARFCPRDGTALRPVGGTDPLIGHTLGDRYHILSLVGEGGMGRIYLAEHVRMNRQCAVKIMRPSLVNDADAAARFAREASSAARIIHPNVAAVFDYGESDGRVYLVMEFVDGEPLGAILEREGVMQAPRAVELARQVADALAAAHELGIVHRDLKPDNILIARTMSGREVAKVVDFGIAKAIEEGPGQKLTETGLVIGTPEFMSPEQLMGDSVDPRSDVYSLGCILYLMLVGVPAADAPTREGMLKRRLNEAAPHPRSANESLPPALDAIVVKALATAPADRYQSAGELRDALAALGLSNGEIPADTAEAPTITMPSHERAAMARPARSRYGRGLGAAGLLVLAATALFLMQSDRGDGANEGRLTARPDSAPAMARPTIGAAYGSAAADSVLGERSDTSIMLANRAPRLTPADSARLDSVRRADQAAAATRRILQGPINRFARAVSSRDIGQLRAAFPGLSPQQEQLWSNNFATFDQIRSTVRFGEPRVTGDQASYDFTLSVRSTDRSGTSVVSGARYTARYDRIGGTWTLTGFDQRP